jgi:hypothetical protein
MEHQVALGIRGFVLVRRGTGAPGRHQPPCPLFLFLSPLRSTSSPEALASQAALRPRSAIDGVGSIWLGFSAPADALGHI